MIDPRFATSPKWLNGSLFKGRSGLFSGVLVAAAGAFVLWEARLLPYGSLRAPDSGFFPINLGVLLLALGVMLTVRLWRATTEELDFNLRSWSVPLTFGCFVLYGLVLERVGFVLCTAVILFAMMTFYGRIRWYVALAVSLVSVLVVYFGFIQLGIPLPAGLLSFR